MSDSAYSPQETLIEMLDQGLVMLHIDARHPDVCVPEYLKDNPHLRLNLSYLFQLPDLNIEKHQLSTTLSFQQQPFFCVIPYTALWGLSQEPHRELHLFPEALPSEMLYPILQHQTQTNTHKEALKQQPPQKDTPKQQPPQKPQLQLVVDNASTPHSPPPESSPPTQHARPTLTLVKD